MEEAGTICAALEGIAPWEVPEKYPFSHIFRVAENAIKTQLIPLEIMAKAILGTSDEKAPARSRKTSGTEKGTIPANVPKRGDYSYGISKTPDGRGTRYTQEAFESLVNAQGGRVTFGINRTLGKNPRTNRS